MSERRERIADLYYRSDTLQVDLVNGFKLSVHKDNPGLPNSPWYMKYDPKKPGAHLLPELYAEVGAEFHEMALELGYPEGQPVRITGWPTGAIPLGKEFAKLRDPNLNNLLEFTKVQLEDGTTELHGPQGCYEPGDELLPVEDHLSGARNNMLFTTSARGRGLFIRNLLGVVDRQQGAVENLRKIGVVLHTIHTGDSLLDYGIAEGHLTQTEYDEVQAYRHANQFALTAPPAN